MKRRLTAMLALFLTALLFAAPAGAGSTRIELLAAGAQTATGQGGGISVAGAKELIVFATCTASSAPTRLDINMQSSSDGGTTWYDLAADYVISTTGTNSDVTSTNTFTRNVLNNVTSCASTQKAVAKYTVFGDYVRASWYITGTSFTIGVKAVAKS